MSTGAGADQITWEAVCWLGSSRSGLALLTRYIPEGRDCAQTFPKSQCYVYLHTKFSVSKRIHIPHWHSVDNSVVPLGIHSTKERAGRHLTQLTTDRSSLFENVLVWRTTQYLASAWPHVQHRALSCWMTKTKQTIINELKVENYFSNWSDVAYTTEINAHRACLNNLP